MLRACICRHGMRRMRQDAAEARARLEPGSPWRAVAELLDGVAHHLEGDERRALPALELAARSAGGDAPLVEAIGHAQLALIAGEEDPECRRGEITAALERVAPAAPLRALPTAVAAALAAARGDIVTARRHAAAADALLVPLARFVPWYVAEAGIWLARAHIRLSDAPAARRLLTAAARHCALVPDAPLLAGWLHETWERADEFAAGAHGGGPALTTAELRVLRLLPSHLSFREIGARLHVSPNTVKTQALSIYRKFDVCSRSDAVTRGRAIGLIAG
jgi:LuxR family maltose regulon positive regulatory protein